VCVSLRYDEEATMTVALDPAVVDDATVEAFRQQGAVVVRRLFEPAEVATIERGIERNLADPSPLSLRFLGDDATHAPRPWRTSPPFEGLELPAGAPMHHPIFPVLRTRT